MSLNSINTNVGAQIALQSLNATNAELQTTQNEVSTGLKVSGPSDNGAVWAIAQGQRSQITSLGAVTDSLNRAASAVDVAVSAGQTVSDLLNQLKSVALDAADASQTTATRSALDAQFKSLLSNINQVVTNASFNGANLVSGSATSKSISAFTSADGKDTLTVQAQDLSLGGTNLAGLPTATTVGADDGTSANAILTSASAALGYVTTLTNDITNVNNAVATLGTSSNAITTNLTFVSNLSDALNTGVGNLVDADVAAESATLTALQTKQQLGVQALSIANSASSSLLSLFRS